VTWIVGRPPFTVKSEVETFRAHRIDVLVAKDAGGPTVGKLTAARELGLPVVMIRRPSPPPGDRAASVDEALGWLERLL
jgi:precorrin-6A/cobalt-precorrin-6A reductase